MMNNKNIKVGTFFSGIGSPEKALEKLKNEKIIDNYEVMFFSEVDKSAIKSYCAVHDINEKLNLGDITKIEGKNLPYCDLWIGGFPCQDISCAGKMKGFNADSSTRSSLGWEMIRLLKEVNKKPMYIIFENVATIKSKKFEDTLYMFKNDLINLGYTLYDNVLNAIDYEIPQTRKRYFLVAILDKNKTFKFPEKKELVTCLKDFLENNIDEKYYLTTSSYEYKNENTILFKSKDRNDIEYEIDLNKCRLGGICGKDKYTKFQMSSRIYSIFGNAPTLTACNTNNNCKIVIE